MKIRLQYLIIFVLLAIIPLTNGFPTNISIDNQKSVTPQFSFYQNYQESYNMTNNGLKDYTLLKTEVSTDVPVYLYTQYTVRWNHTLNGGIGYTGVFLPTIYMPVGIYNVTFFLGLGGIKAVNNPDTLVSGTYLLNLTAVDITNSASTTTINVPKVVFEYNTSQISNAINYGRLLSPIQMSFSSHTESASYYKWNYTQTNGQYVSMISEVNHSVSTPLNNGTLSMNISTSLNGLTIGKVSNNNVSFTTEDVPVGYPFSLLKLPRQLKWTQFKEIMTDYFTNTLQGYNVNYINTTSTIGINITDYYTGGYFKELYEFNQTSGILMNYNQESYGIYSNASESLILTEYNSTTNYSIIPIDPIPSSLATSSPGPSSSSNIAVSSNPISSTKTSLISNSSSGNKSSSVPFGMWFVFSLIFLALFVLRRRR